jgi:hypothetical protein
MIGLKGKAQIKLNGLFAAEQTELNLLFCGTH